MGLVLARPRARRRRWPPTTQAAPSRSGSIATSTRTASNDASSFGIRRTRISIVSSAKAQPPVSMPIAVATPEPRQSRERPRETHQASSYDLAPRSHPWWTSPCDTAVISSIAGAHGRRHRGWRLAQLARRSARSQVACAVATANLVQAGAPASSSPRVRTGIYLDHLRHQHHPRDQSPHPRRPQRHDPANSSCVSATYTAPAPDNLPEIRPACMC